MTNRNGLISGVLLALLLYAMPAPEEPETAAPPPDLYDFVEPEQLAGWILEAPQRYVLIDLRPEEAFMSGSIKTAVSIPDSALGDAEIRSLPRHRRIVVFADEMREAAGAWHRIRAVRSDVTMLAGGMASWESRVLKPAEPPEGAPEQAWQANRRARAVAAYFLGEAESAPVDRERVAQPVLRQRPKARSGGC